MKKILSTFLTFTLLAQLLWGEDAIEDFESYSDNSELQQKWTIRNGNKNGCNNPILSISTKESYHGSKAMKWVYNNDWSSANQGWESIGYSFSSPQNWKIKENLSFWVKGHEGNSAEHITVILYDYPIDGISGNSKKIGEQCTTIQWPTQSSEWTEIVMPLDEFTGGESGNRGLEYIDSIEIGIKSTSGDWGYGTGTLYFDAISIPEPSMAVLLFSGFGILFLILRRRKLTSLNNNS
jgi:hypothetical protein